jgi:tetratricopeptide (TPR) repeat protein
MSIHLDDGRNHEGMADFRRERGNRTRPPAGRAQIFLAFVATLLLLVACSRSSPDRMAELQQLLDDEQYEEVLSRVQLDRKAGESGPWLDYAAGVAHLHQNADQLAATEMGRAVGADSTLAPKVAVVYQTLALKDADEKWYGRAQRRMREAFRYDPGIVMEPLADSVADYLYRNEKNYRDAFEVYRHLAFKETTNERKLKEWTFRYGHCLERLGFPDDALATYRDYLKRWPNDRLFMAYVQWRYQQLLQTKAREAMDGGDLDGAMSLVEESLAPEWHMELHQQGRYLAGQISERRGDLVEALRWYGKIVEDGEQFGGEVLENAKERIDAIHAQGIH